MNVLDECSESRFQSIVQHLDWAEGWWIGWVFSDTFASILEIEKRVSWIAKTRVFEIYADTLSFAREGEAWTLP